MTPDEAMNVDAFRCTHPGYGHHAQIVTCQQCGHIYANPRWTSEELVTAYTKVEDKTYVDERAGRELTFQKHLQAMEKITGPANGRSLLDVGAYIGVFVETALAAGWDAVGVEPSTWAAQEAQKAGLPIIQGTQTAPELANRQFDVLTMWDVIEHVADPNGEIARAGQLLKSGGTIAIHTMDVSSLTARLMGQRWPWYMDMHIHYFSQDSLGRLLQKHNFELIWSGTQGRYLRLGYLATRVAGLNATLGKLATTTINNLRLASTPIPINFGDLFTIYARKK